MTEKTMEEKYQLVREPLKAQDIEVRVGNVSPKGGATLLLYKTARTDTKRLDNVFNGRWKRRHYMDGKNNIVCEISIYDIDLKEWISREDVGVESNTEKEKGAYSDSFKRAGFTWGIGVELYDAPFIYVQCEVVDKKLKNRFEFNDAQVTKFEVIDGKVFVEIKNKNTLLFSNFANAPKPVAIKQPAPQQTKIAEKKITSEQLKELQGLLNDAGKTAENLCKKCQVKSLPELTETQYFWAKNACEKEINNLN